MTGPILVLGASGQLGRELTALARDRGISAIGADAGDLDIRDALALESAIALYQPRLIANCAAYTAVDKAESEHELAFAINAAAPGTIAAVAATRGIPLLHMSTDYVFDGNKPTPYGEDDDVAPLSVYGRTKAQGEAAVRKLTERHIILRTSWAYGRYGSNFLKTVLRCVGESNDLRVVADQRGCPTATADIAGAILAVDAHLGVQPNLFGTFHFAGTEATTWHGFAEAIVAAQAPFTGKRPSVKPIGTSEYPTAAIRPANSELNSNRFTKTFGYRAQAWHKRIDEVVAALTERSTLRRSGAAETPEEIRSDLDRPAKLG